MSAQLKETLSSIITELKEIASTKTVVGEPIALGNKMVVPVSRIMVGKIAVPTTIPTMILTASQRPR